MRIRLSLLGLLAVTVAGCQPIAPGGAPSSPTPTTTSAAALTPPPGPPPVSSSPPHSFGGGSGTVTIPSVAGLPLTTALERVQQVGLIPQDGATGYCQWGHGATAAGTRPPAGTRARVGDSVWLDPRCTAPSTAPSTAPPASPAPPPTASPQAVGREPSPSPQADPGYTPQPSAAAPDVDGSPIPIVSPTSTPNAAPPPSPTDLPRPPFSAAR